jgi:hypothetical protein
MTPGQKVHYEIVEELHFGRTRKVYLHPCLVVSVGEKSSVLKFPDGKERKVLNRKVRVSCGST